jgi:hypothetical protein
MPRYYFHLYNDLTSSDEEGQEFPDLEAAREHAISQVRAVAADEVLKGKLTLSHRIVVADENGSVVATVRYADAVAVRD